MKLKRLSKTVVGMAIALAFLCFYPLPHFVMTDFVIRPGDAQSVYVNWPGNLREIRFNYGDAVAAGNVVARLENPDLELKIEELQSELDRQNALLNSYRLDETDPLKAASLAGEARATILQLSRQLSERTQQYADLELTAQREGIVIPPSNIPQPPVADGQLEKWSGIPLEAENLGASLERETLVCYIGDSNDMTAVLTIHQEDMRFVRRDQNVALTFNSFRGQRAIGSIEHLSTKPLATIPRELSSTNGGSIAPASNTENGESPLIPLFEATVRLEELAPNVKLVPGMTGKAKVRVGSAPLAIRFYRSIVTAINFR